MTPMMIHNRKNLTSQFLLYNWILAIGYYPLAIGYGYGG